MDSASPSEGGDCGFESRLELPFYLFNFKFLNVDEEVVNCLLLLLDISDMWFNIT